MHLFYCWKMSPFIWLGMTAVGMPAVIVMAVIMPLVPVPSRLAVVRDIEKSMVTLGVPERTRRWIIR